MDFELTEEQRAFQESVRRFAQRELAAGVLERAHRSKYPWEVAQKIAEQGLMGIAFPEEDGGMGGTLMDAVIAIQEVALVCPTQRRHRAGRQLRPDPHLRRVRQRRSRRSASCPTCWRAAR